MANMKGAAYLRNSAPAAKQSFLPPKSPFPIVSPSYAEYGSIGSKGNQKTREGHRHHQRTSSEGFLIEEQPSWLEDLLNEPETPARRGAHRRSSSDSFAYLDGTNIYSNLDSLAQEECRQRGINSSHPWVANEFEHLKDAGNNSYYPEATSFARPQNRGWESHLNSTNYRPNSSAMTKEKAVHHGPLSVSRDPDAVTSSTAEKKDHEESVTSERKEGSQAKHPQSEVDPKRAKQQFAQRSRVRKLQYIAELERNVQALQAEGIEVSAEMDFVSQQNLMLDLENKALKQRLESLAQEQLIKRFQQEMFEREIARLRSLYQQQLQPQPAPPTHSRSSSADLDSHFASLSLKQKDPNSGRDTVSGPLRI
ncbi:uncharacterized protein At4g06598-like [Typha latifolia]|uniref:uncharacterized protein At4g06598-like n=1 Tax=Typha latifolia TaxID=4733 RepID=UPI003C2FF307